MKGNKTLRKYLAIVMARVFAVSGIIFTPKSTSASAPDASWTAMPSDWGDLANGFTAYAGGAGGGYVESYYKANSGDNSAIDLYVAAAPTADWGLQMRSADYNTTAKTPMKATITFTADKAGSIYTKEDYTSSGYASHSYSASEETSFDITFTASDKARVIFNFTGVAAETTFTGIKVTYSEVVTTTGETTTRGETEGNIIEGMTWQGWFEAESWSSYPISTSGAAEDGYSLSNKNIYSNWYSIQTGLDGVSFSANTEYTCSFYFTTSAPKSLIIDNREAAGTSFVGDATIFTETADSIARGWQDNGDGTYTYHYEGTYNNSTSSSTTAKLRVSLGYNAAKTDNLIGGTDASLGNFSSGDSINCSLTDMIVTPTSEYNPGDGYDDCVDDGYGKYSANGWGYLVNEGLDIGFRTGTYDGYEYYMELKNRDDVARTAYIITDNNYTVEEGKTYSYSVTIRNNSSTAITPQLSGCYYGTTVLNWTSLGTAAASDTSVLTGTFTAIGSETNGRFQIQLPNMAASAEIGVTAFSISEVSPWQIIDSYGAFTSRGDWEYYVDSNGEAYYDSTCDPNTYDEVGFKYVKQDSSANSTKYRMRTSVLSDSEGNFNEGDYYDYSFNIGIDDDSEDALSSGHLKVVEYTGDTAGSASYVVLETIGAINKGNTLDVTGTCGATVNGSRIGIVVDTEDDISLHITDFEVSRRGSESGIIKSSKVSIEGFQIQQNNTGASVSYRTLCKAPAINSEITVDGDTYTVAALGTTYVLDPNDDGNNAHNVLDDSYTILDTDNPVSGQQYKYQGVKPYQNVNRTYGYEADSSAIIDGWKEGDTANSYYAFTMQGMDDIACNTLWVRPFIKVTKTVNEETVTKYVYGTTTAYTSVAEIADYLYANSLAKNITAHQYLFSVLSDSSIIPTSNPHHRYANGTEAEHGPVTYGWSNTLYIGFRLIPDTWTGSGEDNMQYVNVEDWRLHANSSYGPDMGVPGASASYKGVNNEEMMVRIEQPGFGHQDEWENFINWGVQIRYPNRKVYDRLVDGKRYTMTIRYKTTKAGTMRVKYEGNTDLMQQYEDAEYDGHKEAYIHKVTNQKVGYNEITETFTYHDGYSHAQNDASIVFAPCGSLGSDDGFPAGTILSEFEITFDEVTGE